MQPTGSGSPWPMWPILSSHSLESWSESELTDPATPRITRELTIVQACAGTGNVSVKSLIF